MPGVARAAFRPCSAVALDTAFIDHPMEHTMHPELRRFLFRFIGTVALTLVPVIFIAFVSMPLNLNRHPGEPARPGLPLQHMT